jgi:hypothetical protein
MSASQVPIDMSAFPTKLEHAAWRTQPNWAFDQAMPIHMAERINTRITKVSASHAVFIPQPAVFADIIDEANNTASAKTR